MGDFEEMVKIAGCEKEVHYIVFGCILKLHEPVITEPAIGFDYVFCVASLWFLKNKKSSIILTVMIFHENIGIHDVLNRAPAEEDDF